jgi:hypothetical protein
MPWRRIAVMPSGRWPLRLERALHTPRREARQARRAWMTRGPSSTQVMGSRARESDRRLPVPQPTKQPGARPQAYQPHQLVEQLVWILWSRGS